MPFWHGGLTLQQLSSTFALGPNPEAVLESVRSQNRSLHPYQMDFRAHCHTSSDSSCHLTKEMAFFIVDHVFNAAARPHSLENLIHLASDDSSKLVQLVSWDLARPQVDRTAL